jgi:hypothetical protein
MGGLRVVNETPARLCYRELGLGNRHAIGQSVYSSGGTQRGIGLPSRWVAVHDTHAIPDPAPTPFFGCKRTGSHWFSAGTI